MVIVIVVFASVKQNIRATPASAVHWKRIAFHLIVKHQTQTKCARDTERAHVDCANVRENMWENFVKAFKGMRLITRCVCFTSRVCRALFCRNSKRNVQIIKMFARKMACYSNRNSMMISRVSTAL
jgi:hypothetical protein